MNEIDKKYGHIEADYKGFKIDVPKFDVVIAKLRLEKMTPEARSDMMLILEKDLDKSLPKLHELDPEDAQLCLQDIAIWHANERIKHEGDI